MTKKLIVITGATGTGKTSLGLKLAKEFNGEILSADSRQVYKYMDIGTGKDLGEYEKQKIAVWGIDLVQPDYQFNVSEWVAYATKAIKDIQSRGKVPIIVGGTGLYIKSLLYPPATMTFPVDQAVRDMLGKLSTEQLQRELMGMDRKRWELMNESDRKNPRRLIRAIEVAKYSENFGIQKDRKSESQEDSKILIVGLTSDRETINSRINSRVEDRIRAGMEGEVKSLVAKGYCWDLPSMSSLGYKEFMGIDSNGLEHVVDKWKTAEHQYAKRQMTYLVKYLPNAKWVDIKTDGFEAEIRSLVANFVK